MCARYQNPLTFNLHCDGPIRCNIPRTINGPAYAHPCTVAAGVGSAWRLILGVAGAHLTCSAPRPVLIVLVGL